MKLSRKAMRALRKLPRPIPPITTALRLGREYSSRFDHWLGLVEATILNRWDNHRADAKNPFEGPPIIRPVAPERHGWIDFKLRALRADIGDDLKAPSLRVSMDRAVIDVDTKATKYVKSLIPISIRGSDIGPKIDAFRRANLDRITSLASERVDALGEYLLEAEMGGYEIGKMTRDIRDQFDVSKSKANLLARDQTLKLSGQITKERQTQAGISKYVWSTSLDERVRDGEKGGGDHASLEGEVFTWGDPPVTNPDTGERNEPGEDYQCRCVAIPVLPSIEDLDDA